jgi:serine/threonine protein kinase
LSNAGDLTGAVIAEKYELTRLIRRGGMGAVYEARNTSTLKRCAVKVLLSPELAGDHELVRRFFREARASGLIESEHVIAAYDSGVDDAGHVYYVMDYLQGEDLRELLQRVGALSPAAATKILLQAATGLARAHALGIVHRDVKPANLFLSVNESGEVKVKILDFGVAKVQLDIFEESSNTLTRAGTLLGTPTYMSPEQIKRASDIDESADVWSLGVVLFECLSGKLPWGEVGSVGELLAAILTMQLPLVQDYAPWVTPELAEVMHRALSRDAAHRMHDAAELYDALRPLVAGTERLHRHELTGVSEDERSTSASRLSFADTVMVGVTPRSGVPVVTSLTPNRNGNSLVLAAGLAALIGASAWTLNRNFAHADAEPTHVTATSAAPMPAAPSPSSSAPPVNESPPVDVQSLWLKVPEAVTVHVDGVSVPVQNARVELRGTVGAQLKVRLSGSGQDIEFMVFITNHGLEPSEVRLRARHVGNGPRAEAAGLPSRARPAVQAPVAAPDPTPGLTPDFE